MIFDTPLAISQFQAVVIKKALLFYTKTGMKVNTAYTPKNMLAMATKITGKTFKRGQYVQAAEAIEEWLVKSKETPTE